jgi:Protein of unknown function (DUF3309)
MLGTILLVVLILMLIGAIPSWSHSRNWGYGPSSGLGVVVVVIAILLLTGRM